MNLSPDEPRGNTLPAAPGRLWRRVYFDHLATAPLLPEVLEAMTPFLVEPLGSPSAAHAPGIRARDALALARQQVATLIGAASPLEIIFTSGGTEATNLAIKGAAFANAHRGRHLVVSAIEHPAVLKSVEFLEQHGFTCTRVPVDAEGSVAPEAVRAALTDQTILVAVQHANYELGTLQPVAEIGRLAGERGIPFFVDATISGGWVPIDVEALGVDLLSLSPHRFHGPTGVGVLYRNRRGRLVPMQQGGPQEGGRRAGVENIPAIVGGGAAAALAGREMPGRTERTARLQRRLWDGLSAAVPCLTLNGPPPGPRRLGTVLNLSAEFIDGEAQVLLCDVHGIAIASGSTCVARGSRVSPVLAAIGLPPVLAQGNIVLSLGRESSDADVDHFLAVYPERVVAKLRGMSPGWDDYRGGLVASVLSPSPDG